MPKYLYYPLQNGKTLEENLYFSKLGLVSPHIAAKLSSEQLTPIDLRERHFPKQVSADIADRRNSYLPFEDLENFNVFLDCAVPAQGNFLVFRGDIRYQLYFKNLRKIRDDSYHYIHETLEESLDPKNRNRFKSYVDINSPREVKIENIVAREDLLGYSITTRDFTISAGLLNDTHIYRALEEGLRDKMKPFLLEMDEQKTLHNLTVNIEPKNSEIVNYRFVISRDKCRAQESFAKLKEIFDVICTEDGLKELIAKGEILLQEKERQHELLLRKFSMPKPHELYISSTGNLVEHAAPAPQAAAVQASSYPPKSDPPSRIASRRGSVIVPGNPTKQASSNEGSKAGSKPDETAAQPLQRQPSGSRYDWV